MSKSLRQDFHRAAFTNLNVFIKIVDGLAAQADMAKAHATAPDLLTMGRSLKQIVLDDLMKGFATVMRDVPDTEIPKSFYKQMLTERNAPAPVTDADVDAALGQTLGELRAPGKETDSPSAPEFLLLFNESVPQAVSQNLIDNWVGVIRTFGQLMFTDEALNSNTATTELVKHVKALNADLLKKTKARDDAIAGIVKSKDIDKDDHKSSNDNKKNLVNDVGDGMVIHYAEDIPDVDAALDKLVGLKEPKDQVKEIRARVKYKQALLQAGLLQGDKATMDHYIFRGPPGTGKTTFARMIGKIYKDAGLLDSGHVVEGSRVSLVGGYVGQTAIKTQEAVEEALDGVLFIDEAYSLFGQGNDFGKEAVEVILRAMEVYKGNMIVVFAGYNDKMDELIKSNPGLTRRFKHTVNFKDFQIDELMTIFDRNLSSRGMTITPDAKKFVENTIQQIKVMKGADFGNAGTVENIVDLLIDKLALAVEADGTVDKVAKAMAEKGKITPALKTRMTQITMAEAVQAKPKNEIVQTARVVGFDPS